MTRTTGERRLVRRLAIMLALGVLATSLTAAPALAAKRSSSGSTTSSTTLTLVMVRDANGNGAPNWGDTITWQVSTTLTTQPYVEMYCYQNGVEVFYWSAGYYAGYSWPNAQNMILSSDTWTSGAASCSAQMYYSGGRKTVFTGFISVAVGA